MLSSRKRTLQVGTQVFYPAYGVADVIGVEEKCFGPAPELFYVLVVGNGDRVLLPVKKVETVGVRELVSIAQAHALMEQVARNPMPDSATSHRQRLAQASELLKDGVAESYTQVLQRLLFRSRSHTLGMEEKRLLNRAQDYFVTEMAAVLAMPRADIAKHLTLLAQSSANSQA
jgi:CarD family transcriptional regulator